MMSSSQMTHPEHDEKPHLETYQAFMNRSTRVGVPFAIGLTMMFTGLVLRWGVFPSAIAGLVLAFVTFWIVKLFFSH